MIITALHARQILDSRGNPTVEADVWVNDSFAGRASVPSGASTGVHEAHELRDEGAAYGGKGVLRAVGYINGEIAQALKGKRVDDQFLIDDTMIALDGTANKSRLGANAILAVSLACAHAAAKTRGVLLYSHINDIAQNPAMSIPLPMMNVLNGGKHASQSADFQEFMIIPMHTTTYAQTIQVGSEIFHTLNKEITQAGGTSAVGDEGGFTFPVTSNSQMLDLLNTATTKAHYAPGSDIAYAMDVAAAEFYADNQYTLATEGRQLSHNGMIAYLAELADTYPIVSIEDGLDQDAWEAWSHLQVTLGNRMQLVGDDLLVTNPKRLQKAIDMQAGNAILIKPNQIGTLSETLAAIRLAKEHNWRTVVSHRSGETEDVSIAHIAVGAGADQIKTGSLSRSERTAKHNELMRIESADSSLRLARPFN